jgi:drug/metabolite transporter (DMT)-like permease
VAPALLTTLLFALTAVCATQSALAFGPERANLGRLLIAVLLLGAWSHGFGQGFGGGQLPLLVLAGMIGFGAGGWCMFQAFPRIGSTLALLVVECAAALVALLLGWIFLGAAISPSQALFTALILGGLFYALAPYHLPGGSPASLWTGVGFTVLGALGQGISWVLTKTAFLNLLDSGEELGHLTAAYQRLIGGFFLALVIVVLSRAWPRGAAFAGAGGSPFLRTGARRGGAWMLANALAGPVLGVSAMMWAIRSVGNPGLVQAVVATATLFSVPLSRLTENRRFRPNYFLGTFLALSGVGGLLLVSP